MVGQEAYNANNWVGVDASSVGGAANIRSDEEFVKTDGVLEAYDNYTQSAVDAFHSVMKYVGDILPKRDTIDARIIAEAKGEIPIVRYAYIDSTGQESPVKGVETGVIDTQKNLVSPEDRAAGKTAWDVYTSSTDAPADTDQDGIPDDWENAHSLNSNDITDGRKIADNGYSNLENYLNSMDVATSVSIISDESNKFRIYPNPVSNIMRVQCSKKITQVDVYDIFGKKINSIKNPLGITTVPMNGVAAGLYLVKAFSNDQHTYQQKIIKQ
jgi:pectate lyase